MVVFSIFIIPTLQINLTNNEFAVQTSIQYNIQD